MSRVYHSASSDSLVRRCPRAAYYVYVLGLREPRVEWSDVHDYVADRKADARGIYWWRDPNGVREPVTSRQRSTALGVAMHSKFEGWYQGHAVDWHDVPGQIALSGAHFLPTPGTTRVLVERPIGDAAIVGEVDPHAPPVGLRVAGVLWAGFRDLLAFRHDDAEWSRLRLPEWSRVALMDHKSSASVERYALASDAWIDSHTAVERAHVKALRDDFQANLYALATMTEYGLDAIPARWVYYETKRRRYAEPRDAVIYREPATAVVLAGCERAREFDSIRDERDAIPNPLACGDYGGCPHHHSVGGPCEARRSMGALIQARASKQGQSKMALPPGIQARAQQPAGFGAQQPAPAAPGPAPAEAAPAPAYTPPPAPAEAAAPALAAAPPPPPAEPARKPRQQKAATAPAAAPAAPSAIAPEDLESFEIPGNYGPLTVSGHARDVLTAVKMLMRAGN